LSDKSKIEWTDATWNPVTGCTRVSPGCDHCYALRFAERWRNVPGSYFAKGFDVTLRSQMLSRPLHWKKPRRIFVNSMSDLFHAKVPDNFIGRVFDVMEEADWHVYQILTKRPERMRRFIRCRFGTRKVPRQIWLGTSVENNAFAWRADMLRDVNVGVRFLSIEPMLGPVNLVSLRSMSWVIAGGESGPGYRPMEVRWVRHLRDRCERMGIAFFFKQWHKGATGRELDGRVWNQFPPAA
jgi:protein gp37